MWLASLFLLSALNADDLLRSVVRIENKTVEIFSPSEQESSHGTGFIYQLGPRKGLVFTNRHVIEAGNAFAASQITLKFNVPERVDAHQATDSVKGKVEFISPYHDFAVVSFDPRELDRAADYIRPFEDFARRSDFSTFTQRLRRVYALGNPMDSSNSFTDGSVNTIHIDPARGQFIQISAPINGGNSGGPLLDAETLTVIGINSSKLVGHDVDSIGYALPIWLAIEDYERFLENPKHAMPRQIAATFLFFNEDRLHQLSLKERIEEHFPDFFKRHSGVVGVDHFGAPFESGDLIMAVEGAMLGSRAYELVWKVHSHPKESISLTVLRRGKLLELEVPIIEQKWNEHSMSVPFLIASDLVFSEDPVLMREFFGENAEGARVIIVLPEGVGDHLGGITPLALVQAVDVRGVHKPIKNVSDLEKAIRGIRPNETITYYFKTPAIVSINGNITPIRDPDGFLVMIQKQKSMTLPAGRVITSKHFSLERFKKNFDFTFRKRSHTDWRDFCATSLKKTKARKTSAKGV